MGAFCLVGTALVAFRLDRERPPQIDKFALERLKETRLAQKGNANAGGLISPDGQYLLYNRFNGAENGLWLTANVHGQLAGIEAIQTGESIWATAFAPDNSYLYYILKEKDADDGNVYSVPLLGGPQKKLTLHANGALTVSPDGQKLAFQRIDREAGTSSIVVVNSEGEDEQTIASAALDSLFCSLDWAGTETVLSIHLNVMTKTAIIGTLPKFRRLAGLNIRSAKRPTYLFSLKNGCEIKAD